MIFIFKRLDHNTVLLEIIHVQSIWNRLFLTLPYWMMVSLAWKWTYFRILVTTPTMTTSPSTFFEATHRRLYPTYVSHWMRMKRIRMWTLPSPLLRPQKIASKSLWSKAWNALQAKAQYNFRSSVGLNLDARSHSKVRMQWNTMGQLTMSKEWKRLSVAICAKKHSHSKRIFEDTWLLYTSAWKVFSVRTRCVQ